MSLPGEWTRRHYRRPGTLRVGTMGEGHGHADGRGRFEALFGHVWVCSRRSSYSMCIQGFKVFVLLLMLTLDL